MRMRLVPLVALILISIAASQDTESPQLTQLTGNIRVDGKPLKKGRILFYSQEGQIVGCIVRDGKYKIEKPPIGEQVVTVDGQNIANRYADSESSDLTFKIEKEVRNSLELDLLSK